MNITTAAVYVRVSSEMQLDGHSLDAQERVCREYCARHDMAVAEVYREEAESASSTDRPELQRMLTDARAGAFAAIVFYHTWRFSRSIEDAGMMRTLERTGVRLISATEAIDANTPSGKLQRNITLAIGQHYLDQLRAETTRGKQQRALQTGRSNASRPPFGYTRIGHDDVPNGDADTARELFERYATGQYSDMALADWMNAQGKRTSGNWGARPFGKDTIRAILMNPFYCGMVGYRGLSDAETDTGKRKRNSKRAWQWRAGTHQALISVELFEACQRIRAERGYRYAGRKPAQSRVYVLSRLARCARCGRPLRAMRYNNGPGYRCTSRECGLECSAEHPTTPEGPLLVALDALIAALQLPEHVKAAAVELLQTGDETAAIERRRDALGEQLRRVGRVYRDGGMTDAEYDRDTARIRGELASLARPANAVNIARAVQALDDMAGLWTHATPAERAGILRALFDGFIVDTSTRAVVAFDVKNENSALFGALFRKAEATGFALSIRNTVGARWEFVETRSERPFCAF